MAVRCNARLKSRMSVFTITVSSRRYAAAKLFRAKTGQLHWFVAYFIWLSNNFLDL